MASSTEFPRLARFTDASVTGIVRRLAGFGARIAAGCTSGLGLSGAAVLSLAGFTFLGTFFAVGLLAGRFMKEEK